MSIKDEYHVQSIKKEECKEWFLHKHYARRMPNIIHAFGLYRSSVLCGVCSFGMSAAPALNKGIGQYRIIELNRLVMDEHIEKNLTSFLVSQSLKLLPHPIAVISYADPGNGHHGFIYQATNFFYTGLSDPCGNFSKIEINGKNRTSKSFYDELGTQARDVIKKHYPDAIFHPYVRKHRYFYFLGSKKQKKDMLAKLPFDVLPYPKGENKRYDASYEVKTQLALLVVPAL